MKHWKCNKCYKTFFTEESFIVHLDWCKEFNPKNIQYLDNEGKVMDYAEKKRTQMVLYG